MLQVLLHGVVASCSSVDGGLDQLFLDVKLFGICGSGDCSHGEFLVGPG